MPSICTTCGSPVPDGNLFCTNCGTPVAAAAPAGEVCPICGAPLSAEDRFCTNCGYDRQNTALEQHCTNCGAPLKPGAVFCTNCGTAVGIAASAAPASSEPVTPAFVDAGPAVDGASFFYRPGDFV